MADKTNLYDAHLEEYRKASYIKSMDEYQRLYKQSIESPDTFWAEQAEKYLFWDKKWNTVLRYDFDEAKIEWFRGGNLNAAYNCLDRHLETRKDKIAYYWEGDNPDEIQSITYEALCTQVNRFSAVLKDRGIAKGDRVILYMPETVELVIAMLACARIGAVHCVVFGGFSAKALATRILDCGAKLVITVDEGFRSGKRIPFKKNVANALEICHGVRTVIVVNRSNTLTKLEPPYIWWHEAMAEPNLPEYVIPEPMDAEAPLFIIYTNQGVTGTPRGIVHTHGGYLLYVAMATQLIFDMKDDDVFWCTADTGWITGHSFGIYGSLLNGLTSVLFEGVPCYPDYSRYWKIIEKYQVSKLYTAPAIIRTLARAGEKYMTNHDISSLKLLGVAGDILDPEAWQWYYHVVGKGRCPVVDTYWQIETGGPILTPLPGTAPLKPGSCSFPFFGIEPVILDDIGEEAKYPNQEGVLCIRKPWPGMARTIYKDHEQFIMPYFTQIPGMFFTADEARQDEDGYYHIIGRIDDVINVSGHRLGTAEIEYALSLHSRVIESAVVGYPHPIKGQGIYAFVAIDTPPSEKLKKELIRLVRVEIGPIATIDVIQWVPSLPRTRSGKILRHILDKIAAGKTDELGDTAAIADPDIIENLITERMALVS